MIRKNELAASLLYGSFTGGSDRGLEARAVFRCIACAAALTPPTPPFARGGKSAASGLFSPLAKGGYRGVHRVPLRYARFGIQAI